MSKHSKHHDSKNHVDAKKESPKEDSGIMTLVLVGVATLIIGLALGAVLTMGYFTIAGPVQENNQQNTIVDVNELKLSVETWVNENELLSYMYGPGYLAKINDANNLGNGLYGIEYEIYQENQLLGNSLFYIVGTNLIVPYAPVFDITKPLEIPEVEPQESEETQEVEELSEEEVKALGSFVTCLADKNVVIFGANWCGYTQALVTNLGGFSVVEPIYFECVGQEDYCQSVGVEGYPTVFLNGVKVNPERTISGFADLTGCVAPNFDQQTTTGSCN